MTTYQVVYSVNNLFTTYVTYKVMKIFFTERRISGKREFFCYGIYASLFNLTVFFDTIPIVYLILSLSADFMITLIYKGSMIKRFFVVIINYCIMVSIELLI